MLQSQLFKRILVVSIFVFSTSLYTIIFIPEPIRDLAQLAGVGIIILLLLFEAVFGGSKSIKQNFKIEIYMIVLATFFSMFIANAYHHQSFGVSLVAQRYMYYFFFYFFLHSLKIDVKEIEKMIIPLALIYVTLYITQYLLYPSIILDSRVDYDRGTVRIFLTGGAFMVLGYYRSLQQLLATHKFRYGLYCLIFFVVPAILQGTRQSLVSISFVTVLFILFSKEVKSRIVMILLVGIASVSIVIIFQDMFLELIELSKKEASADKPNIRLIAMNYFLNDFMAHDLAYIFGNGQDSMNSPFGLKVNALKTIGLYQSDIGIIGDYSKFGALFVIAQLSIMGRIIFGKLPKEIAYFRFFFISRVLVMFTGSSMMGSASNIAFVMIALYMIDYYKAKERNAINTTEVTSA